MKHTKQRRHRKAVTFFTACFGFRKPFKVLCDGTFVHNLVANRVLPADKAISNTLSAPVKLFTTRCVLEELKRLGRSHSDTLDTARGLAVARCDHGDKMKADNCIFEIVKDNNSEHFFVATQDADLRRELQQIPGVPVMFGLRNALFLETPSSSQRKFVKDSEAKRLHVTDSERKRLLMKTGVTLAAEEPNHSSDIGQTSVSIKTQTAKKGLGVKEKPQFKRRKAKGPNPLSRKKKKTYGNEKPASQKEKETDKAHVRSRGRKRNRSRKSKEQSTDE